MRYLQQMSFFNAYQLLTEVAREHHHQRETFSTAEITARINEIKYLSSQKKVPKLSLRKEIVHLERQLSTVMEVEQQMLNRKRHESSKVKSMKKQMAELQRRLVAAEDKDVQKKLDHLSQLLGDYLAKKTTEEEVKAAIAELKGIPAEKRKTTARGEPETVPPPVEISENMQPRIKKLQQRLEMLKGELELLMILKKDARAQGVGEKITAIEQKLNAYTLPAVATPPEEKTEKPLPAPLLVEKKEIKHTVLFETPPPSSAWPKDEDLELEKELPLPPPPKMKK